MGPARRVFDPAFSRNAPPARGRLLLSLILAFLTALSLSHCSEPPPEYQLTVTVIQPPDDEPITAGVVEFIRLDPEGGEGRPVLRRRLEGDNKAQAVLPAGRYGLRMSSGYTGEADITLNADREITLEVLPVLR